MLSHREVMQTTLEAQHCGCCSDIFLNLIVHHKDGNSKNNKKNNLIVLCQRCHSFVHHGLKLKWFSSDSEKNNRVLELRKIYLLNKKNLSKKKALLILEYETWILGNCWISPKTHCNLCKKRNDLVYYMPKVVKRLVPKDKQLKYSFVFCRKCLTSLLKEMKNCV